MGDISSWDGTLTLNEFCIAAHTFADKWKTTNSAWSWVNAPKRPLFYRPPIDEGFLSLDTVPISRPKQDNLDEEGEAGLNHKEEAIDDATLVYRSDNEVHYYDFHVVYSASYRVPVLYFRGYCSDGQPLQLSEIEKDLPSCSAKAFLESKWTFITQEEHPYFNRPWYKLHPCGTSEWMKLLVLGDALLAEKRVAVERYLVSWFSVVGQVIGLRIPIEMMKDHVVIDGSALDKKERMK